MDTDSVWRALVSTPVRIALVVTTALLAIGTALVGASMAAAGESSLARATQASQLVVSILTPMSSALLMSDVRTTEGSQRRSPRSVLVRRWAVAAVYGVVAGAYVLIVALVAVALSRRAGAERWVGTESLVLGSLAFQLVPVGVGCAAGLLIAPSWLACLGTIVVPLTVRVVLAASASSGAADWLTPLGPASHLIAESTHLGTWLRWLVVVGIWVVLPNGIGAVQWVGRARLHP